MIHRKRNLLHWRQQFSQAPLWGNSFCVILLKSALSVPKSSDRGAPEGACLHLQIIRWRDEAPSVLSIIPLNTPFRKDTRNSALPANKKIKNKTEGEKEVLQ